MVELDQYKKTAIKMAQIKFLGADEGYSARIPNFQGLIVFGRTKREAVAKLESAAWPRLSPCIRACRPVMVLPNPSVVVAG